jgi:CDP-diacylglycerol---glycerol-3-phosphate 3-phosphatidyltransferase
MDFHRGHRAKNFTSYTLLLPLKANFMPNHNVRVGFFKHFHRINANAFVGLQEVRGVQHMKIAVFDDHVLLTGANLSDSYFTDREDRWVLLKDNKELADYCDDLTNTIIDVSYQMDDEAKLIVMER